MGARGGVREGSDAQKTAGRSSLPDVPCALIGSPVTCGDSWPKSKEDGVGEQGGLDQRKAMLCGHSISRDVWIRKAAAKDAAVHASAAQ
eukprot:364365-Chlamydomonas_euryale.AAC.6